MTPTLNKEEFQLLSELIEKECGIRVEENKTYLIESRLAKLVMEAGCDNYGDFYRQAKQPTGAILKNKIVDAMTTNETLWFRDEKPYMVMRDVIYPEFIQKIKSGQKTQMNIWSAACSTGQEPYSLVMMAYESGKKSGLPDFPERNLSILATDISSSALKLAQMARYDRISMTRGMLPGFKEKYFEEQGAICSPRPEIKKPVRYKEFNLQNSFAGMGKFDVIMLRNVAIYFSKDFKAELFSKIAASLNPGGYLFLGSSESLLGFTTPFVMKESERCVYYQMPG